MTQQETRTVVEHPSQASPAQDQIAALAPWFHNIHLPDGRQTHPDHPLGDFPRYKWEKIAPHLPDDLNGCRVLDVGCNAGYYSIALAQRGAHVVGIDINPHYLRQAEWVRRQFGLDDHIELRRQQVYDLAHDDEMYDFIIFMGVLYHLRYPQLGLDILSQKARRQMIFQTLMVPGDEEVAPVANVKLNDREQMREPGWPKLAFVENEFCHDPTNWWVANHPAVLAMARSSGLQLVDKIGDEIYLFEPNPQSPSCITTWNRFEILSATGRPWREAFKYMNGRC